MPEILYCIWPNSKFSTLVYGDYKWAWLTSASFQSIVFRIWNPYLILKRSPISCSSTSGKICNWHHFLSQIACKFWYSPTNISSHCLFLLSSFWPTKVWHTFQPFDLPVISLLPLNLNSQNELFYSYTSPQLDCSSLLCFAPIQKQKSFSIFSSITFTYRASLFMCKSYITHR